MKLTFSLTVLKYFLSRRQYEKVKGLVLSMPRCINAKQIETTAMRTNDHVQN